MSQCMIFVSAEMGLSAQVGVPGLKKRSAKKGWVFWQFHHEHIDVETGVSDMIYTHPDTDLEHQFVSWVEGVLVTDVKEHANGVFSGKMMDGTLVGVHQLEFKSPLKRILDANLVGTETGRISAKKPIPSSNLPKSRQIPVSTQETIQKSVEMAKALVAEEREAKPQRPVEEIVSDIRKLHEAEMVDTMLFGGGHRHMPGTPFWEQKSDEAKFRIWKRIARRHFGSSLHRVVKNKAGHESIVSRRPAIERKFLGFFLVRGNPMFLPKSEIARIFADFAKFQSSAAA